MGRVEGMAGQLGDSARTWQDVGRHRERDEDNGSGESCREAMEAVQPRLAMQDGSRTGPSAGSSDRLSNFQHSRRYPRSQSSRHLSQVSFERRRRTTLQDAPQSGVARSHTISRPAENECRGRVGACWESVIREKGKRTGP